MQNNNLPRISKFRNCKGLKAHKDHPTITSFFEQIREGTWKHKVENIRRLKAEGDLAGHKKAKEKSLPAFIMSGVGDTRKADDSFVHNGILCMDIDGKENPSVSVEEMNVIVQKFDYVAGWFVSPSGDGLKVIIKVAPDKRQHLPSFLKVESDFSEAGLCVDKKCKDITRLCIASYDPKAELRTWDTVKQLKSQWVIEDTEGIEDPEVKEVIEFIEVKDEYNNSVTSTDNRLLLIEGKEKKETQLKETELKAKEELQKDKVLEWNYYKFVAPYVEKRAAYAGKRNEALVDIVTFLYRAVGEKFVIPLAMAFFDLNQSKFSGTHTREEHEAEAKAQLQYTKQRWFDELLDDDLSILEKLPTAYSVTTFRICRDLAMIDKPDSPHGQFYLGQTNLSKRLGASSRSTYAALNALHEHKVIKTIEKGGQYSKGNKQAKATTYQWLLPNLPHPIRKDNQPQAESAA